MDDSELRSPGAQFSGATWRVTVNNSLRRIYPEPVTVLLHYVNT